MSSFFIIFLFGLSNGSSAQQPQSRHSSFIQYPADDATSDVYIDLKDPFISDPVVGMYPKRNGVYEVSSSEHPGRIVYSSDGSSYAPVNQGFTVQAEPVAPFISETIVAPSGYGFLTQPESFLHGVNSPLVNLRPEIHLVEVTDNYVESPYSIIEPQQPYPPRTVEYGVPTYGGDYGVSTYGQFNTPSFNPQLQNHGSNMRYVPLPYNPVPGMGLGRTRVQGMGLGRTRPVVPFNRVPAGVPMQPRFPQGGRGAGLGRVLPAKKEHDHSKNQEVVMFALGRVLGRLNALDNNTDTAPILQRLIQLEREDEVGTKPENINYPPWTIPPPWGGVQPPHPPLPPPASLLGVSPNMGLPSIVPPMSYGTNSFQSMVPTAWETPGWDKASPWASYNLYPPWMLGNSPWTDTQQSAWPLKGDSSNPWSNFMQTPKKESKPWWYELIPAPEKQSEEA
jgi:hypothetical protein